MTPLTNVSLRKIKPCLRSITDEDRLNGLCMMNVHRERVNMHKDNFILEDISYLPNNKFDYLYFIFLSF